MAHVLTSIFFPFLQKISPSFLPTKGLKKLEDNTWEAINHDPQFTVKSSFFSVLSGWISIRVKIASENIVTPKLYFDFGEGYSEARVVYMIQIDEDTFQAELMLPKPPKNIRFDPAEEQCLFTITEFQVKAHSEILHIAYQFISIMKHDHKNDTDTLRILRKSYARYKKYDWNGMLERLEKEYSKLHPFRVQQAASRHIAYLNWIRENEKNKNDLFDKDLFHYTPLISVIMPTYNTPMQYLKKAIDSVISQSYPNWELCIADDASTNKETIETLEEYEKKYKNIKVLYRATNGHISEASNSALTLARGEYIAFLDHDDTLAPNALYEMVKKRNENQSLKLIYSDEDKIDENDHRYSPHFKSGWNPDMLFSQNYICHLLFLKKEVVDAIGGFRRGYEGSQDYDLVLRAIEQLKDDEIGRVEKILYHWRAIKGSTAYESSEKSYAHEAGLKALQDYFSKKSETITVEDGLLPNTYKVNYPPFIQHPISPAQNTDTSVAKTKVGYDRHYPLVSLLIPTRDGYDILHKCVDSILEKTTYPNYEILILDNETICKKTLNYFENIKKHKNITILEYHHPFNYSAINNYGVKHAKGEIVGLINNDVEVITEHWLTEMVQHAIRPEIGAVGAKLYYDNDTIQHAGVVLGIGGVAGHAHKYFKKNAHGYFSRLKIIQSYSAVTGACLVVKKELYEEVGGLDEENLKVAFNDVDFCLKLLQKGYRNLWTPYVELYHHESISRGAEDNPEKIKRFNAEVAYMKNRWFMYLEFDNCYNCNLTNKHENFGLS